MNQSRLPSSGITLRNALGIVLSILGFLPLFASETPESDLTAVKDYGPYQPLFTDGKEWLVVHGTRKDITLESLLTHTLLTVSVEGGRDRIIDGIPCKCLKIIKDDVRLPNEYHPSCGFCFVDIKESPTYIYAYEQDRKIMIYRDPGPHYEYFDDPIFVFGSKVVWGDPYFDLYMDLNVGKGDFLNDFGLLENEYYQDFGSLNCRVVTTRLFGEKETFINIGKWIEGIGSNVLYNTFPVYSNGTEMTPGESHLALCTLNGEILYDIRDQLDELGIYYGATSDINSPSAERYTEQTQYYNLQGLPVKEPLKGTIYISNGRKIKY